MGMIEGQRPYFRREAPHDDRQQGVGGKVPERPDPREQAIKRTPLEQLEDGVRERLDAIRESRRRYGGAGFTSGGLDSELFSISRVIERLKKLPTDETPLSQLEKELEDNQSFLERRIERGVNMSPLYRKAHDLEISQLREKVVVLKGGLPHQEGSQRSE